jgi:hypothetical protein
MSPCSVAPVPRARLALRIASVAGAVVLVVAACGGDDDDDNVAERIKEQVENGNLTSLPDDLGGDPDDLPDPCKMVTAEDAGGLFSEEAIEEADSSPVDLGASCIYGNAKGQELGNVSQLLQVRVFDGEQFFGAESFDDEQPVDGLGEQAFVRTSDSAAGGVEVQFLQDGKTVSLSYSTVNIGVEDPDRIDPADHDDEVVALAKQAAGRM